MHLNVKSYTECGGVTGDGGGAGLGRAVRGGRGGHGKSDLFSFDINNKTLQDIVKQHSLWPA